MNGWVGWTVLVLAVLVNLGAALLFTYKVIRFRSRQYAEVRRAAYIAALGEVATRGAYPLGLLQGWAADRVFRDTLVEYLKFLEGDDREHLLSVARELGITDRLLEELRRSRRSGHRVAAASGLVELGDESAIEDLTRGLSDRVPEVRLQAAAALAKLGAEEAVPVLIATMDSEEAWGIQRISDALVTLGPAAVPAIVDHLEGVQFSTPPHAAELLRILGLIRDTRAESVLIDALASAEPEVRIRAAAGLGRSGGPVAIPALNRALSDSDWRVRSQAARSLGRHVGEGDLRPLRRALRDENWWVRQNASAALGSALGGLEVLADALSDADRFAVDAAVEQLTEKSAFEQAALAAELGSAEPWQHQILDFQMRHEQPTEATSTTETGLQEPADDAETNEGTLRATGTH